MESKSPLDLPSLYEQSLEPTEAVYLKFHQKRFVYVVDEVLRLAAVNRNTDKPVSVMDIGPHFQTTMIRQALGPSAIINTLGWQIGERIVPSGTVNEHFTFDLNNSPYKERWIDCPQHDIIVMAEVFEHIYTAPEYFLGFLRKLLKPGGYLIIGTPNAVCLNRRYAVLTGRNPFDKIRVTINNPGHFREYTTGELQTYAQQTGFTVESITLSDFYRSSFTAGLIKKSIPSLRDCIHIVFQKTDIPDSPPELILW